MLFNSEIVVPSNEELENYIVGIIEVIVLGGLFGMVLALVNWRVKSCLISIYMLCRSVNL